MDPVGSIQLTPGKTPRLGDVVTFDVTFSPNHLDKSERGGVRIQVLAYDDEDKLIYAEAFHYDYPCLLGSGSSSWLERGGPATCRADLYFWDKVKGVQVFHRLASTQFDALGAA